LLAGFLACWLSGIVLVLEGGIKSALVQEVRDFRWLVFLNTGAPLGPIRSRISSLGGVNQSVGVSKENVLKSVEKDAMMNQTLSLIKNNPFPDYIEVSWNESALIHEKQKERESEISSWESVESVVYNHQVLDRLKHHRDVLDLINRGRDILIYGIGSVLLFGIIRMALKKQFKGGSFFWDIGAGTAGTVAGLLPLLSVTTTQIDPPQGWAAFSGWVVSLVVSVIRRT